MLDFYKGMDLSFLPQLIEEGIQIKDFDNSVKEPLVLMKKYGVNSVRLRLWNEPNRIPEAKGYCDLHHTIEMARKIKEQEMSFLLDFHYSDFWADPGQQRKPKAWEKLSGRELEDAVYMFTRDTLLTLRKEGLMPDLVQIGNEIRSGLLFPDGELPNWDGMVRLINAGIHGAREAAKGLEMKVMIHLDQGGRYLVLKNWFDQAQKHGLEEFDLIGLSYYPFWHGTFMDLKDTMERLIQDFHKPILIAETAHAWRRSQNGFIDEAQERIAGIPATPYGQKKELDLVMNIVASLPEKQGLGIYYWEPLCLPKPGMGGWSENMGILDEEGRLMEAVKAFLFTRQDACPKKPAKIYGSEEMTILKGTQIKLPEERKVLYYDGSLKTHPVKWKLEKRDETEGLSFLGEIEGIKEQAHFLVKEVSSLEEGENLVQDSNWDEGLTAWDLEKSDDDIQIFLNPEIKDPFPAPPIHTLRIEALKNFHFVLSQKITLSDSGWYRLQVSYRGTDTTNVDVRLFLQSEEQEWEQVIHPTDEDWTIYTIEKVFLLAGVVKIGIKITAPPIYGLIKGFRFGKIPHVKLL